MLTLACTLLVVATPPSTSTPGATIRRVDADAGVVVERREVRDGSTLITNNVITFADSGREETFEVQRCVNGACAAIPQTRFDEEMRREIAAAPEDQPAVLSLYVAALPSAKNGASALDENATRFTHRGGKLLRATAEPVGEGARARLRVEVDDEWQPFAVDVPWSQKANSSEGAAHAWLQVHCGEMRCLVVAGWINDAAPQPAERRGLRISKPFVVGHPRQPNGTFPLEVLRVDVASGKAAYRQFVWEPRSDRDEDLVGAPGMAIRWLAIANISAASGDEDVVELCRAPEFDAPPCTPSADRLALEEATLKSLSSSPKIASTHFDVVRMNAGHVVDARHAGHVVRLGARTTSFRSNEIKDGAAELFIDVDGERRFRLDVPWPVAHKPPLDPNAWIDVHCGASNTPHANTCVVVARTQQSTGMGMTSLIHFASLSLRAQKVDAALLKRACGAKPAVGVVANGALVASEGERWAAALRSAGCRVESIERAKAQRAASVVYAKDRNDAGAKAIAHALGANVEQLTWPSTSPWIVAIGG